MSKKNANAKILEGVIEKADNFFRLEEMYDSMSESISNINNVVGEQTEFCSILEQTETQTDFTNFIKSVREQTQQMTNQLQTLITRQEALKKVIDACKEDENVKASTLDFVFALGLFA